MRTIDRDAVTPEASTGNILPVETITLEPVDAYEIERTYTGEIAALRSSNLGLERSGEVVAVLVGEGDRVVQGQPLAQLDQRNLQAQRQQLKAQQAEAQARLTELEQGARAEDVAAARAAVQDLENQLQLQQTQRQRREFLYAEGAISKEQLDEFTFGEKALQARLDQARSNLAELVNGTRPEQIAAQKAVVEQLAARLADLDVTLAKSTLNAPFNGIVSQVLADEGTVLGAGQPVLRLVETVAPEARIGIPEEVIPSLEIGNPQTLQLGSKTLQGTVTAILPEIDPQTRTQEVVFRLDGVAATAMTPGQTVRVTLTETTPAQGFWLPTAALTQGIRGLWTSYVLTPSAQENRYEVQQQAVEIVHQEDSRVLVRGTLQAGDRLVASGTHRLVPGQIVRPLP